PYANFNGTDRFTYRATDGTAVSAFATYTITVNPVNDAPQGTDNLVTTREDTAYTFTAADFGFSDPADAGANQLMAVWITTPPAAGTLVDGGYPVYGGQFVTRGDIDSGLFRFVPDPNANGAIYTTFTFQVQDTGTTANGGADLDPLPNTM